MNKDSFSPDKLEDIHEVVQKIYPLFDEYDLTLQDAITVVFTILVMGTKDEVKNSTGIGFFNLFTRAHNNLIDQILDFEESLDE